MIAAAAAAQRVSEAATVADTLSLVSYVFQPTRRLMIALVVVAYLCKFDISLRRFIHPSNVQLIDVT